MDTITQTGACLFWGNMPCNDLRVSFSGHFPAHVVNFTTIDLTYSFYRPGGQRKIELKQTLEKMGLCKAFYLN